MTNHVELRVAEKIPFADGHVFNGGGAYERLSGRVHFAVEPKAKPQHGIVDLEHAPRDEKGLVRFAADFMILRPADASRGNRRLLVELVNRGNKRALQFFNDAPHSNAPLALAHAGNGFLMRRGYTLAWVAWQGDLLPGDGRMILDVPVATDGQKPITGKARMEFIADEKGVTSFPLSGRASTRSYPTASLDPASASLTRRRYADDRRIPVPPAEWQFARVERGEGLDNQGKEKAIVPSDGHIHLAAGFAPGWIYELVYTAKDPLVLGLGHAAVRDFTSFLKRDGKFEKAYGWGRSQTGRCLRDFVYRGFNADADGRRVFDGILPHVAGAGRKWLNQRFANPVIAGGQQHEDHVAPADRFPFSYASSEDHLTGKRDAILKRPDTDPLVIHTQTSTEYWQRRGSLVHTDTRGNDLAQPETVRIYNWASSQHFADPRLQKPTRGVCQNFLNTVATSMLFRATLDALDRWASDGKAPPPSRIPRVADGTLVTHEEWEKQFPKIPGVARPRAANDLPLLDFGPDFDERGIATKEPPETVGTEGYAVRIPSVDADGNETAGIVVPTVAAPLGTYTGWNLRARGFGHGAMHEFTGSYIPFPDSPEERAATRDPRRSVLERYKDKAAYANAIRAAAKSLVEDGFMLEEDVERCAAAAADWGRPRHEVGES